MRHKRTVREVRKRGREKRRQTSAMRQRSRKVDRLVRERNLDKAMAVSGPRPYPNPGGKPLPEAPAGP